jgi:hypothetical protein
MSDTYESMWDESDDEFELNENEIPEIDNTFKGMIMDTKRRIYAETIFSGIPETEESQNMQLMESYLKKLNKVYNILKNAENNNKNINDLSEFNEETRRHINNLTEWVYMYFKNNSIPDTIPYSDYIKLTLHIYPYVQNNNFEEVDDYVENNMDISNNDNNDNNENNNK